jgi:hypothetical protein
VSSKTQKTTDIMSNEITYTISNDYGRNRVRAYHDSPTPREMHKGAKNSDIVNLKSSKKRNLLLDENGDMKSRFTIGIEIEKNRLHRGSVKEYPLLKGFERDGSCGYEAITNILPLLPSGKWRNKVFNMMFEARKVIEDQYSPSNYRCGGHITIGVEGMSGQEVADAVRKNVAILHSLFHKRISNGFCKGNLTMLNISEVDRYMNDRQISSRRYQFCAVKRNVIEFRVVSRFQSVKQMMRRYELMYELLDFSINNPNGSFNTFLKRITPIVKSMYNGDMDKVAEKFELAKHFRKMVLTNKVNRNVIDLVDPMRRLDAQMWYDRDLLRNGYRAI